MTDCAAIKKGDHFSHGPGPSFMLGQQCLEFRDLCLRQMLLTVNSNLAITEHAGLQDETYIGQNCVAFAALCYD